MQRQSHIRQFSYIKRQYCRINTTLGLDAAASGPTANWGVVAYSTQPADLARNEVAVLVCDVVAYCRLIETDTATTIGNLRRLRQAVVHPVAEGFGARTVRFESGDSMLLAFDSAVDALRAAVTILTLQDILQRKAPREQRLRLRIGLSLGRAIVAGDGVYGNCVNIAGRLQAIAKPSSVCLCERTRNRLPQAAADSLQHVGRKRLHNIDRVIDVFRMGPVDRGGSGQLYGNFAPPVVDGPMSLAGPYG